MRASIPCRPLFALGSLLFFATLASTATAGDGVVELNQACATQTGCSAADAAGFPITLGERGSYRLTSNLEVPDSNTNGIEISSDNVSIDFNGFTLLGPSFVPIGTHVCTLPGTGSGIVGAGPAGGFSASNGTVRGMGKNGIDVFAQNARVERMVVERNCETGIRLGVAALVSDCQVRVNGGWGIDVEAGSRVRDSIAASNKGVGILTQSGSIVTGSVAIENGRAGIVLQSLVSATGGVAMGNVATGNGWDIGLGGISVVAGGVATQNSVTANFGGGIDGDAGAGAGLNAISGNTGAALTNATPVGCNVLNGVKTCP